MQCSIRLYSAKLPQDRNSVFYLTLVAGSSNQKYYYKSQLKNIEINQTFVVKLDEEYALGYDDSDNPYADINYLTMQFEGTDYDAPLVPYYVDKIIRNTKNSIIIYAVLDTVNYINNYDYLENNFTENCLIERTHLNRWKNYGINPTQWMNPIVDFRKEDFDIPVKYLTSSSKMYDKQDGKWYAIYYSDPNNTKTGVRCFLVPKTTANFTVNVDTQSGVSIVGDTMYIIRAEDNPNATITMGAETITLGLANSREYIFIYNNGGTFTMHYFKYALNPIANNWNNLTIDSEVAKHPTSSTFSSNVQPLIYYKINEPDLVPNVVSGYALFPLINYNYNKANVSTSTESQSITGLESIPRTNSRIIKIIDLPYFPCSSTTATNLKYQNIVDDFMNINVIEVVNDASFDGSPITVAYANVKDYRIDKPTSYYILHDIKYESKFDNSDYDEMSFEYGPYKYTIQPEMYAISAANQTLQFSFLYKQAKLKSAFSIKITNKSYSYKGEFGGLPNEESNFIISDLDNEIPVYNSDYINYMKNGYNYDKESIARQTTKGAIGMAVGLGGAALGALVGGPVGAAAVVGMGASAVSQMSNIIISKVQSEANLAYKVNSYRNSKTAVSSVSDLELREQYKADALYLRKYKISDSLKKLIYDFWRLYGYKYNEYDNPATLITANKRHWYNYIKLGSVEFKPEFLKKYGKHTDIIEDYKNKLLEGITIYKENLNSDSNIYESDFEQKYENLEEGIVWEE